MVTRFDNKTPGAIQLTVNYEGFTDRFNVTIKLKEIQNNHNENIDTTNKEEQDTTIANKVLPTTGLKSIIIISIILLATISVYMYYKVRKYKDVK